MKKIFPFILLAISISANSQTIKDVVINKNTITYKADIINEELVQNYLTFNNEKHIYNKVLGKEVQLYIDTLFKKYTVIFKDEDNGKQKIILKYIRDYFIDGHPTLADMYVMEYQGKYFWVTNAIKKFGTLTIVFEEKDGINTKLLFIKNIRKVK